MVNRALFVCLITLIGACRATDRVGGPGDDRSGQTMTGKEPVTAHVLGHADIAEASTACTRLWDVGDSPVMTWKPRSEDDIDHVITTRNREASFRLDPHGDGSYRGSWREWVVQLENCRLWHEYTLKVTPQSSDDWSAELWIRDMRPGEVENSPPSGHMCPDPGPNEARLCQRAVYGAQNSDRIQSKRHFSYLTQGSLAIGRHQIAVFDAPKAGDPTALDVFDETLSQQRNKDLHVTVDGQSHPLDPYRIKHASWVGDTLLVVSSGSVWRFDAQAEFIDSHPLEGSPFTCLNQDPSQQRMVLCDFSEPILHLWDPQAAKLAKIETGGFFAEKGTWSADGTQLVAWIGAGEDGLVWIRWDAQGQAEVQLKKHLHEDGVEAAGFTQRGLLTAGPGGQIKLWEWTSSSPIDSSQSEPISGLSVAQDGRRALLFLQSGGVQLLDTSDLGSVSSLGGSHPAHRSAVTTAAWMPPYLATADRHGVINVWNMDKPQSPLIEALVAHEVARPLLHLRWTQAGQLLSIGADKQAILWKASTRQQNTSY